MITYNILDPEKLEEKKKLKSRIAILYIGSIILFILLAILWFHNSPKSETLANGTSRQDAENIALLNQDELLHQSLKNLDQLDISYAKLVAAGADSVTLNNLDNLINTSETAFSDLIDSISNQKSFFKNQVNAERSDNILYAFVSALNYRKSNSSLRTSFFGNNKNLQGDTLKILQLQANVQNKTETIDYLMSQLNFKNHLNTFLPNELSIEPKMKPGSMQAIIKRQRDSIQILLSVYNSLIKDNTSMASQLKTKTNDTDADKINSLNSKIDDLYAELTLQKVDCNLTRVSGKDIISTARQRKDLLQESLNSLRNLAGATNPVVQRKVKDKMLQLQNIAATARN